MRIQWLGGDNLNLRPSMHCDKVVVHTCRNYKGADGKCSDQLLLVVNFNAEQIEALKKHFPCMLKSIPYGAYIVPLVNDAVLWSWTVEGYDSLTEHYKAFSILPDEEVE